MSKPSPGARKPQPRKKYVSARERLKELGRFGPFFEGRLAMQLFGWSARTAAHYLWLWKADGLIKALGGKSDIYFNLVTDPDSGRYLEAAVRRAMPGATLGARNVLHAAGITTQRPAVLHLLTRPAAPSYAIDHVDIAPRRARFWNAVDTVRGRSPGTATGLPRLSIGAALADSALDIGGLAPDDIDFDEVSGKNTRMLRRLLEKMGVRGLIESADANTLYRKARKHAHESAQVAAFGSCESCWK